MTRLTEAQGRAVLCGSLDIDRRMASLEATLGQAVVSSPLSPYSNDLSPIEAKVVRDYFARIRAVMIAHLKECGIPLEIRRTSVRWSLQCGITLIGNVVAELRPERLSGYGPLDGEACIQVVKLRQDLERLLDQVAAYLRQGEGSDLAGRVEWLQRQTSAIGLDLLSRLEEIVSRRRLVEFRPAIEMILRRYESLEFEVAVFGRVSSGKSSFLNHLVGMDALPVGVTPITAVPIRVTAGETPSAGISFAEAKGLVVGLEHLWEYASESGNPGNAKHVVEIVVRLSSPRLQEGVVFIDTPGVGSLALSGETEALAYLPRCDLGVVLIDAASTLQHDDLAILRALHEAGTPAILLLSKSDLLTPDDRSQAAAYIRNHVQGALGIDVPVHPVSTVGADESLLIDWYGKVLSPLLGRHQELARESLARKVAALRESVAATLETIRSKRRGEDRSAGSQSDAAVARAILDEADAAIRGVRERVNRWPDDKPALIERTLRLVAETLASRRHRKVGGDDAPWRPVHESLSRRAKAARGLVAELQAVLGEAVESLARDSPPRSIDAEPIRSFRPAGLPFLDLTALESAPSPVLPWWTGVAPMLAGRASRQAVEDGPGPKIRDTVEQYDRRLQKWIHENVGRVGALYEAQASAFREQVRRLLSESSGDGVEEADDSMDADLDLLRQYGTTETAARAEANSMGGSGNNQ